MKLSVREAQILDLLCHGFTNKAIAQQLGVSPHTVRDHISAMSNRFHVTGRTALATEYKCTKSTNGMVVVKTQRSLGCSII